MHHGVIGEDEEDVWSDERPEVDWSEMAEMVKDAFRHAYGGYEQFASPHDELLPLSNGSVDKCVFP